MHNDIAIAGTPAPCVLLGLFEELDLCNNCSKKVKVTIRIHDIRQLIANACPFPRRRFYTRNVLRIYIILHFETKYAQNKIIGDITSVPAPFEKLCEGGAGRRGGGASWVTRRRGPAGKGGIYLGGKYRYLLPAQFIITIIIKILSLSLLLVVLLPLLQLSSL